ncbi:polyadenylate-binding protein-interacting protein 4-like isoform X2 [Triticum urartu]|uniref:polyadenylate-binding protein-interacting protein 4-like isoform X2 n=1 Tax=Triticum urartu TaxID=4572 RepID=UPI002044C6B9|nr:polyadenylate-binding protein-interacting protein 4-like isoform X2 [Triticum urartu]
MMSRQQQHVPLRTSANGAPHRKLDREGSGRHDSKSHLMRSSSGGFTSAENGGKLGHANPSRDRLVYVMTQIIGHHVDVHVKNGSVISGIFHATNTDKDFGIILKMAQPIKDTSVGGQINTSDVVRKPETMIIPAQELVQVFAKDVTLGGDELPKGPVHDKRKDLMIDSAISRSHFPEERELERWAPDEGDSDCIELEKFDRKGHRSWDQFETNAALFGVKSTFNEDLYTTKLERGPHMRELEKHASRIAREIEGEDTEDLHLAEERGLYLDEDLEHDEEIKYSAVRRDTDTTVKPFTNVPSRPVSIDTKDLPVCSSTMDDKSSSHISGGTHLSATAEYQSNKLLPADANRLDGKRNKDSSGDKDNRILQPENTLTEGGRPLISEDLEGAPSRSRASEPSSSGQGNKSSDGLAQDSTLPTASAAPGLSPSSSMGSLSSDKSSLNPNAKEFKLNPNAKSFTPLTSPRPHHPPAPDATYYYPNNMGATGPGLPVGMGFPQAYGGQPVVYNAQPGSSPQGYMHPSGQQYGQQMMMGQTRPVYYYAPEMQQQQYRGRNF